MKLILNYEVMFIWMLINLIGHPLVSFLLARLRDKTTDSDAFRRNLKKLGRLFAFEVTKDLDTREVQVETPLGHATHQIFKDSTVLVSILRAGLPLVDGFLDVIPNLSVGFFSASRVEKTTLSGENFKIASSYSNIPDYFGKNLLVVESVIASGSTMLKFLGSIDMMQPKKIIIICGIVSKFGLERVLAKYPSINLYTGAIDSILNADGYIVPGLGDVGDRAFNTP